MKSVFLFFACFTFCLICNAQNVSEILKNPAAAKDVLFNGQKNETKSFVANASKFSKLNEATISGINDSVQFEQILLAIAAVPSISEITIDQCGIYQLSGAIRMLTNISGVKISACNRLGADHAFTVLSEMPGLVRLEYEMQNFNSVPRSFIGLRTLNEINIINRDLSLADGYALNTKSPAQLYSERSTELGFGNASLLMSYGCYDPAYANAHLLVMRDMLQGTVGSTGEMPLISRVKPFDSNHPLVKAPIPGLDVRKNVYQTNAAIGGTIEYPSGTKIRIPANAFVDVNGKQISGNVTIDYREFRDQVDILVSGIPMKYDSAGQVGDFESAGMFEMNASVNGQEVFLAPGKNIKMDFAVVDTASSYNFYELDKEKGWVYRSRPGNIIEPEIREPQEAIQLSPAVEYYRQRLSYNRINNGFADTTAFDARYLDMNYIYMDKISKSFKSSRKIKPKQKSKVYLHKTRWKKDHVLFQIARSYTNERYHHSEMNAFYGIHWRLNGKYKSSAFIKKYNRKRGLHDFRLYYSGDNNFTLELKDLHGFEQLEVIPVRVDRNGKEVELTVKESYRLNRMYQRILNQRRRSQAHENKSNRRKIASIIKKLHPDTNRVWRSARIKMNSEEMQMNFEEWKKYVSSINEKQQNEIGNSAANGSSMLRSLSIDGFGIYNCDQIQRVQNPVDIFAVLEDKNGNSLKPDLIYIIDRNTNSVLTFGGGSAFQSVGISIVYGKNADNRLMGIKGDQLFIAGNESFAAQRFINASEQLFAVDIVPKTATVGELRAAMFGTK